MERSTRVARFGQFEVDLETGELRKSGVRIRLQHQPFQVLSLLLDRPSRLITRDELRERLWAEQTFVDFEHGVTSAVKKLRRALNDSAEHPRYIETLPKRGYRFIGHVDFPERSSPPPDVDSLEAEPPKLHAEPPAAALVQADEAPPAASPALPESSKKRALWAWGAAAAGLALAWIAWPSESSAVVAPSQDLRRFTIDVAAADGGPRGRAMISPNGRHVVFVGGGPDRALWVHDLSSESPRRLSGTEGARRPFWSSDSSSIGFATDSELRSASVHGGGVQTLSKVPSRTFLGGAWSLDGDSIVLAAGLPAALYEVPAEGGEAELILSSEEVEGGRLLDPTLIPHPDRDRVIAFTAGRARASRIVAHNLDSGERRIVGPGSHPVYSPSGHLLYQQDEGIVASPFSTTTLDAGPSFPVAAPGLRPSVSSDGTLVYVESTALDGVDRLVWVGRDGRELQNVIEDLQRIAAIDVSPDGRRAAVTGYESGTARVWLYELEESARSRLTVGAEPEDGSAWAPDSGRIAFSAGLSGADLFLASTNGEDQPRSLISSSETECPNDWSPDGSTLLFTRVSDDSSVDIWSAEISEEGEVRDAKPWLASEASEFSAQFSPDGRYVAFCSDESGRLEVYVTRFPRAGPRWRVSRDGGCAPRWNPRGGEIFYHHNWELWSAEIRNGGAVSVQRVSPLFDNAALEGSSPMRTRYDVSPDGERFLLATPAMPSASPRPLRVIQNWAAIERP